MSSELPAGKRARPEEDEAAALMMATRDPKLTRQAAARDLGISPATLESDISRPRLRIPYHKLGRRIVYAKSDLDAFLARCRIDPSAPTKEERRRGA